MVNSPSTHPTDRRARSREAEHVALGSGNLHPFGDLHTLQHLSARLARGLRPVFEPLLRKEVRSFAEPLSVQRLVDYRAERPDRLTAWLTMPFAAAAPQPGLPQAGLSGVGGQALLVIDGHFVLELLDLFFGGNGHVAHDIGGEFTPAAEALVVRLGGLIATPLAAAWEPLARMSFVPGAVEANPALLADLDQEDAVIVTRFGIAVGTAKPQFVDILYPVAALKPLTPSLNGRVHAKSAVADPAWRTGLARAAMNVRLPIRSVLAEPMVSLARLMELKVGDVIPIHVEQQVPVMVGRDRLGMGTVGAANGHAAIQLTQLAHFTEEPS